MKEVVHTITVTVTDMLQLQLQLRFTRLYLWSPFYVRCTGLKNDHTKNNHTVLLLL